MVTISHVNIWWEEPSKFCQLVPFKGVERKMLCKSGVRDITKRGYALDRLRGE